MIGPCPASRRDVIKFVGGGLAWPISARAQSSARIPTIGVLWHAGSADQEEPYFGALRRGLEELGYVDGRSVHMLHRFPNEKDELFRSMAAELVASNPDVLVGAAGGASFLKAATSTIPIVFMLVVDALEIKLVDSLSRPGGNLTGPSLSTFALVQKRFQLLRDIIPNISKVGLLISANEPGTPFAEKVVRDITRSMGLVLGLYEVRRPEDLEPLFREMVGAQIEGLVLSGSGLLYQQREVIFRLAIANRLPTVSWSKETLVSGALISYGADLVELVRHAAPYIDKILRGAKPSELPVEEPTSYNYGVNLKTAKLIGIDLPQSVYARADELIE